MTFLLDALDIDLQEFEGSDEKVRKLAYILDELIDTLKIALK